MKCLSGSSATDSWYWNFSLRLGCHHVAVAGAAAAPEAPAVFSPGVVAAGAEKTSGEHAALRRRKLALHWSCFQSILIQRGKLGQAIVAAGELTRSFYQAYGHQRGRQDIFAG
jgi:hypothetical protein